MLGIIFSGAIALSGLQAYDVVTTSRLLARCPGTFERTPYMRPFSHGGAPTMALGFAIQDMGVLFTRHATRAQKSATVNTLIVNEVVGILQTSATGRRCRAGGAPL